MNEEDRHPAPRLSGVAMLITGLPAAGKTTLGAKLAAHIEAHYRRLVTVLDGEEVRQLLSSELGYSREDRRLNALRHGYIAAQVCRHGGIAICALIAPYATDRAEMRRLVTRYGAFIEIYLSTPLAECERRDPKGLYARARAGELKHMTGIDDPYEPPVAPELEFDGSAVAVEEMVRVVIDHLAHERLLPDDA